MKGMPMKVRKFYPAQVLRKLHGRAVAALAAPDLTVLNIGMRRARKAGVLISVVEGVVAVHNPKQIISTLPLETRPSLANSAPSALRKHHSASSGSSRGDPAR